MKNYKKDSSVLIMGIIMAGSVFAQEVWGGKKNFVSADLGVILAGARYERLLTSKISVGADFYWANSFIIFNELEAGLFGRYYIWNGLFAELGLGYHIHSGIEDTEYEYLGSTYTEPDLVATNGFAVSPGLGWKFDPGKAGGFTIEPGIAVPITIGTKDYGDDNFGVSTGFVIRVGLGFAF
jgi:hypothetical protein